MATAQPSGFRQPHRGQRVEHCGQLHDQHELAVLLGREHDELPLADGRARLAQLRLSGARHRDRDRRDPGRHPDRPQDDRELLGRYDTRAALRFAADQFRRRSAAVLAGDAAELQCLPRRRLDRRLQAGDHRGADGVAGGHQGTRHQRRRFRQREFSLAERESDAVFQPLGDAVDLQHRRGAHVHVRPLREGPAPGMGAVRRDGAPLRRRLCDRVCRRVCRQSDRPCARRAGRKHGGEGVPLRSGGFSAVRDGHDRHVVRRGQLDARLVHAARRVRPARGHATRARSSSAVSGPGCTA